MSFRASQDFVAKARLSWQSVARFSALFFVVLGILGRGATASAKDIYISQSGTGSGTSCADTLPASWFNNSANWGSGATQIGPGTTVHLCGTFTGAAGSTMLTFQGNGASGNPIVLLFESGALLMAPYWSSLGAVNTNGNTWITIDGGTSGTIENTLNGTPGGSCLGGACSIQQDSRFVYIGGCPTCNIEVKKLNLIDPYVHTANVNDTGGQNSDGIFFSGNHSNITVDNNTCHDAPACIDGWGDNIAIYNNTLYRCNRCIISGTNISTTSGLVLHDNHITHDNTWDTPLDSYHHDGIHIFNNAGTANMSGVVIYNNLFDTSSANCCNTAHLYLEGAFTSPQVFNNVFNNNVGPGNMPGFEMAGEGSFTITSAMIVNNTFLGGSYSYSGNGDVIIGAGVNGITFKNNVVTGGNGLISIQPGSTIALNGIGNNIYENIIAQGAGNEFGWNGTNYTSLASWQAALPSGSGQDANSVINSIANLHLTSDGHLQTGSPGIGLGVNLTSLGITALDSDKSGVARPTTGPWDAGAYTSGSTSAQPAPPTGLTATVQ